MAVRPLVSTGIALASAGLLIATAPTVVAPLTQKDIKVVADTQVTLAATQLQQILDAYLTGLVVDDDPTDPTPLANNGLLGVLEVLTAGGDFANLPLTNAFITGGTLGVAGLLTQDLPIINAYIAGGPSGASNGILGVLDLLTVNNALANAYISGGSNDGSNGLLGVLDLLTEPGGAFASPVANAYIAGGPSGASNGALGVLDLLTQGDPLANAYIAGVDGGPNGILGVADAVVPDDTLTQAFLSGGAVGVATAVTQGRPILNAYFGGYPADGPNGIIAVTQLIIDRALAEPATEETEDETFTTLKVAGGETETTDPGTKSGLPKWEPKWEPKLPSFSPLVEQAPAAPVAPELPGPADVPAPVTKKLSEKTEKPLVRDSLKFTPGDNGVLLPFGTNGGGSDDWAGKKFVKQLKDAFGGGKGESTSEGGDDSE